MPFDAACRAYAALADLRRRRARQLDYTFGRQWLDPVTVGGRTITEYEFTEMGGKKPLANNLIRQMVKTVIGRFRHRLAQSESPHGNDSIAAIRSSNMLDEMDCRMLEEFLISGCAVQRIVCERRPERAGVWIDNVDPAHFFVNSFTDPRGCDIELIGMVHDMSPTELCGRFEPFGFRVDKIMSPKDGIAVATGPFGVPAPGRCRVVEVWTLDAGSIARCHDPQTGRYTELPVNELHTQSADKATMRRDTQLGWQCRWFLTDGTPLACYPSPWAHGSHPFALKLYPLIAGEVHSFVADVIDQQRYVNRLITLIDHVIGTSAKGALLFPYDQIPPGHDIAEIARQWARPDGVILYQPGDMGQTPQQLVNTNEPTSAYHLLDMELKLMQQISGVSDALGGHATTDNSRSAALFEAQMNASGIALLDTFAAFDSFRDMRDRKIKSMLKNKLR